MCKFILTLFTLYIIFFTYLEAERKEWFIVIVCEEEETIKIIKKN